jgi:DNA-binding transcriptional ArsR family regulator
MDSPSKRTDKLEPLFRRAATEPLIARALSHPKRLATVLCLMERGGEATDEAKLADALGVSLPAMRYHLTVLRNSDLITCVDGQDAGTAGRYIAAASAADM